MEGASIVHGQDVNEDPKVALMKHAGCNDAHVDNRASDNNIADTMRQTRNLQLVGIQRRATILDTTTTKARAKLSFLQRPDPMHHHTLWYC